MNKDGEIRAYLQDYTLPEGMKKEDAMVEIARHFGYDITKEELIESSRARCKALEEAGQAAEKAVEELSVDQLDSVAGGKDNENCKDTFKDQENCWWEDGCDVNYNTYSGYNCNKLQKLPFDNLLKRMIR